MKQKNAYFQLIHKENGTYLKLFPQTDGGTGITFEIISSYLNERHITEYEIKQVANTVATLSQETEVFLAAKKIYPEDETFSIIASNNGIEVCAYFYPPSSGGKFLTKQQVVDQLVKSGIRCGVVENNIDDYLSERQYCTQIPIARAILPVQGKSASISYCFKTEINRKPKINEDGSVDFHQLDMISKVNAGDVLATLTPVDYGKPGLDVYGKVIKQNSVKNLALKHGLNAHLSEDKLTLYSDITGHAALVQDKVFVSNVFEVPADVGVASGDVSYDGNVLIRGNVLTGFNVTAKGDIIVEGVVEGATLISEGQIILKRGIQGMGKGILKAAGSITAKFLENCTADSGATITTDAIMHSQVTAKDEILVTGKRGLITGGSVKSCVAITARNIGSTMGTQTNVSVTIEEKILEEHKTLEAEIKRLTEQQTDLLQSFAVLKKRLDSRMPLSDTQKAQVENIQKSIPMIQQQLKLNEPRYQFLKEEVSNFKGGPIKFSGIVYPGVFVTISTASMYVKSATKYGQFIKDRADIRLTAL